MRQDASRPTRATSDRVTTFELFFDLVFVFAFTQVSRLMAETHSALGILQALIVLALLWWTWCAYAWLGNQAAADRGPVQVALSLAMVTVFIAALAIPEAYHDLPGGFIGPLVLALAYTVVRLIHATVYVVIAGDDRELRLQVLRTQAVGLVPACTALIVGALVGGEAQTWIWLVAVVWDSTATWLSSRGGGAWRIHSLEHWLERHSLVVILALGESIVAVGVGVSREPIDAAITAGTVLAVGISIMLWWSYFARIPAAAEAALERRADAARVDLAMRGHTYAHLPLIAGVVLAALGVEDAMAHIHEAEAFGWFGASALGGGLALYVGSTALIGRLFEAGTGGLRIAGIVVIAASIPLIAIVPPMAALAIGLVLLGLVAIGDAVGSRRAPSPAR